MKKILIVDDNEANLYLAGFLLRSEGYTVLDARNGAEAVAMAVAEMPDLVIMDIQLPDFDGLVATGKIREAEQGKLTEQGERGGRGKRLPIVALTSYAMTGDRERALRAGCDGYIEKPINPETFLKQLEVFL